jgi:hypothetical protein
MARLGERPTGLRIRLPFDDLEANFHIRLSYDRGPTLYSAGVGEEAKRLEIFQENGKPIYGPAMPFGPCGTSCPDFISRQCTPLDILRVSWRSNKRSSASKNSAQRHGIPSATPCQGW